MAAALFMTMKQSPFLGLSVERTSSAGPRVLFFQRVHRGFSANSPAVRTLTSAAAAPPAATEKKNAGKTEAGEVPSAQRKATDGGSTILRVDPTDPVWKAATESKARLKLFYETTVIPTMRSEFGYTNPMQIPKLEKVVINCGIGDASQNAKSLENAARDLAALTGQKPVITRARKAIAGFKLRAGVPVGMATTLRGSVMYAYLDRLMNLALPRMRDFRGVSRSGFDGRGNYSMGLKEQTVFPEIQFDKVDKVRGMDITIATTARTDREGQRLLELLGLPFTEGPAPKKEFVRAKGKGRGRGGKSKKK